MMKLPEPRSSFTDSFDACFLGVTGNPNLQQSLVLNRQTILDMEKNYIEAASTGQLFNLSSLDTKNKQDTIVLPNLYRSDLIKLYDQYFVPNEKPARRIYEELLNAAEDKCPFCGGIGKPRNLDHFLPKSKFPQFSVLPKNLVPSCRDCNMDGKGQSYALTEEQQIIQPYLDHNHFFCEQWIHARYHGEISNKCGYVEYYFMPPRNWSDIDKSRARNHFQDFELARRYGTKAAEILAITLEQIDRMRKRNLTAEVIKQDLLDPGIEKAPFINHWLTGLYQSLYSTL